MLQRKSFQVVIVLVAFVSLAFVSDKINVYHKTIQLNRMVDNPDIPISLSLITFALGPLRAIVVDALWWRAIQQQDRGDYFDALQLSDWITKLQPTYPSIWVFHAWNMSYNIAHDFSDKSDRWAWILRGIELLRDEGLKYNPDDVLIRQELARIFYDRIGNKIDPASEYFKNQWAFLMMKYFDSGTREELESLAGAARSIDELKQRENVLEYVRLARTIGQNVLDFETRTPGKQGLKISMEPNSRQEAASEIYQCYKRIKIENDLKLNFDRLIKIDHDYGPLDWRLHQAHTIYWAAEEHFEDFMKGGLNYSKVIRHSMVSSFFEGQLFYNPLQNTISRTNNLKIIGKLHDYYEYLVHHQYSDTVDRYHKDFLGKAIAVLYTYNQNDLAYELFEHYKDGYLKNNPMSYEDFLQNHISKTIVRTSQGTSSSLVEASLYQSYRWLDIGELDRSNGYFNYSRLLWKQHQAKYQNEPPRLLPPFEQMKESAKVRFLNEKGLSEEALSAMEKKAKVKKPDKVYTGTFESDHHHHHH